MTQKGRKAKGNSGENEAAELFGEWYYRDKRALMRMPGSRGRKLFPDQAGDIVPARGGLAKPWVFAVEVKRDKKVTVDGYLFRGRDSFLWECWRQARQAAREKSKIPLLVYRQNRQPWIVCLALQDALAVQTLIVPLKEPLLKTRVLLFFHLNILFEKTSPADWRRLWRQHYAGRTSRAA